MAYSKSLSREYAAQHSGGSATPVDKSASIRVQGDSNSYRARFGFSLSGLRSVLNGKKIKIKSIKVSWNANRKYTYHFYFNTTTQADGSLAGSVTGTSSSSMASVSCTVTNSSILTLIQNKINSTATDDMCYITIGKSGGNVSDSGSLVQYGAIVVNYLYAEPSDSTIVKEVVPATNYACVGNSIGYNVRIHNSLSADVSTVQIALYALNGQTEIPVAATSTHSFTIGYNETNVLTTTAQIYSQLSLARGTQIKMRVTISGVDNEGTTRTDSETTDFVYLLDKLYNPEIKQFSLVRCSDVGGVMTRDDTGTMVMSTMQIGIDSNTAGTFTLKAYYSENVPVDLEASSYIDLDLATNITTLLTGVADDTTFIRKPSADPEFDENSSWFFKLVLSDSYESASMDFNVSKSFANLHLAGCSTGGVGIGMFSTSTQNNPKFEVHSDYDTYFYGDVTIEGELNGGTDYSTTEKRMPYKWIDGKQVYRKVVTAASCSAGTHISIDTGIASSEFDRLISMTGTAKYSTDLYMIIPSPSTDAAKWTIATELENIGVSGHNISVGLYTGSSRSLTNIAIIIEYTKTGS